MCTDNVKEKTELLYALISSRKLSDLPKISQQTLIIWGEQDQVFPLELGLRLKRFIYSHLSSYLSLNDNPLSFGIQIQASGRYFRTSHSEECRSCHKP